MANDAIIDLTIAFLNSFREFNQTIPMCLIPFDDHVKDTLALASEYNFEVFSPPDVLQFCDSVGHQFHGCVSGQYRKLATWAGPFDEFIYIDVDTVVLSSIEFAFEFLADYDFIVSHSNLKVLRQWVWKDSADATNLLSPTEIAFSANTGFLVSRKGALTRGVIATMIPNALKLADHMVLFCAEQPLLNFLIVRSGRPYTSLLVRAILDRRSDLPLESHGSIWKGSITEGKIVEPEGRRTLLIHWAGDWRRKTHEGSAVWQYYRHLRGPTMFPLTGSTTA